VTDIGSKLASATLTMDGVEFRSKLDRLRLALDTPLIAPSVPTGALVHDRRAVAERSPSSFCD
jgi:hypothetical protein